MKKITILLSVAILFTLKSHAGDLPPVRPEIGLVLSGGGACGMAHVGVLKLIEHYEIPVDYITGTSMGAVIGSLYSCGYSASDIEDIITGIDWGKLLGDRIERKYIDHNEREMYEKSVIRLELENGTLSLPEGLSYGQNIYNLLSLLTWEQRTIRDFSRLPIPFRCVATDIQTGKPVILDTGNLVDAVRASMAIPSVFSAIEIGGKLLVDGGFTLNLPVSEVIDMGADIVIAVDAGTPLYSKEELDNFPKVIDQVTRLVVSGTAERERLLADKVITPDLKDYNVHNFDKSAEIILKGEEAAVREAGFFSELAGRIGSEHLLSRETAGRGVADRAGELVEIDEIIIRGNSRISDQKILNAMKLGTGRLTRADMMFESVERLYGTGDFDLIRYYFEKAGERNILHIEINEAAEQKVYIAMNYSNSDNASLLLSTTYKNLLIDDSRFEFKSKLGENFMFNLRYYLKLAFLGNIDTGMEAGYSRKAFFLYNDSNEKESKIYADFLNGSVFTEKTITESIYAGLAAEKNYVTYKDDISVYDIEDSLDYYRLRLYLVYDSLDSLIYPSKGINLSLSGERIFLSDSFTSGFINESSGTDSYNQVKAFCSFHITAGNHLTFSPSVTYCGTDNSDYEKGIGYFIGGYRGYMEKDFIAFRGLMPGDIIADNVAAGDAAVNVRFLDHFVFTPFYARMYYNFNSSGAGGDIVNTAGASLAVVGLLTGPVEISLSKSDFRDFPVFYFSFGFSY